MAKRPDGANNCNMFNAGGDASEHSGLISGHTFLISSIALTGSEVKAPKYYSIISGASLKSIVNGNILTNLKKLFAKNTGVAAKFTARLVVKRLLKS